MEFRPENYRPLVRLLARKLELDPRFHRRFDSSDLVQETMLRAHQRFAAFRGQTDPELIGWLQRILERVAADEIRKATAQKRNIALEQSLESFLSASTARLDTFLSGDAASLGQRIERQEELLRLARAIESLPDLQRDVVIHRDLNELPIRAIAELMGRTEKSVAGLLLRGHQRLRQLLREESGIEHDPNGLIPSGT